MAKKKKVQSPYIGYSLEEVAKMEDYFFVIQFGGDFISEDKEYLLTRDEAENLHKKILRDLISITKDGSEKDRRYALDLIGGLVIRPMRLH